jgi:nucleoside phosphorylase
MKVDIAIITTREDEFEAVLQRFKPVPYREPGKRSYGICHLETKGGNHYTIAIARCSEQGNDTSQQLAHDIIHDLDPRLILVVGIAGGVPHDEFTLGDVIISTRIHNLNVGAQHEDGSSTFDIRGGGGGSYEVRTISVKHPLFIKLFQEYYDKLWRDSMRLNDSGSQRDLLDQLAGTLQQSINKNISNS